MEKVEFVDIHTHLLPGVDDGASDLDEVLALLRIAYDGGTRQIVLTPHMFLGTFRNNDFLKVRDRYDQLMDELADSRAQFPYLTEMQVWLGAENYASAEFFEALDRGCILTLNGSRYLLVEFYPLTPFSQMEAGLSRILMAGHMPVIAHPERYAALREDPMRAERLWEMGCCLQVNAESLMRSSGSGSRSRTCARRLLEEGLVDVVASDGHRPRWRPPTLSGVCHHLEDEFAAEDVRLWLYENPARVVANLRMDAPLVVAESGQSGARA